MHTLSRGTLYPPSIRGLTCCVCGESTVGRQWWNRDTGYGLCVKCSRDPLVTRQGPQEMAKLYGLRGTHYDLKNKGA